MADMTYTRGEESMYGTMTGLFGSTDALKPPSMGPNFAKVWNAAEAADKTTFLAAYSTGWNELGLAKSSYLFTEGIKAKSAEKMFDLSAENYYKVSKGAMGLMAYTEAINPMFTELPNLVF